MITNAFWKTKDELYYDRFDEHWYSKKVFYRIDILEGRCCRLGKEVCVGRFELLWFAIKELFRRNK